MVNTKLFRISVVILTLTLLAIMVSPLAVYADSGRQLWYLDSTAHSEEGKVMEREMPGEQSGTVIIGAGDSLLWLADEAAAADCTFSGGIWGVKLRIKALEDIKMGELDAQVGYYDVSEGSFKAFNTLDVEITLNLWNYWEAEIQLNSETIPQGDYLSLSVINNDSDPHTIITRPTAGNRSWVWSPASDPGYPLPELAAAILMGAGLLGLSGFIFFKRRKTVSHT